MHTWPTTSTDAIAEQRVLAEQVILRDDFASIRYIAGADIAIDTASNRGIAGIIVYRYPELIEVERTFTMAELTFPYIAGLLSYREGPILLAAYAKLRTIPDVMLFDGQGIAHPRGLGLASHMGILLNRPSIGCAKSRLVGEHESPPVRNGSYVPLVHHHRQVGAVLRTRDNVKPLYISPGHRISIATSIDVVLQCCDGKRVPKPTREADRYVAMLKHTTLQ